MNRLEKKYTAIEQIRRFSSKEIQFCGLENFLFFKLGTHNYGIFKDFLKFVKLLKASASHILKVS